MNEPRKDTLLLSAPRPQQRPPCRTCGADRPRTPCTFSHLGTQEEYGTQFRARIIVQDRPCPECSAPITSTHHVGCHREICPACGKLIKFCNCHFDFLTSISHPRTCPGCSGSGTVRDPANGHVDCTLCSGSGWYAGSLRK